MITIDSKDGKMTEGNVSLSNSQSGSFQEILQQRCVTNLYKSIQICVLTEIKSLSIWLWIDFGINFDYRILRNEYKLSIKRNQISADV